MKDNSTETLIKRINRLEEKLYRYTEIQADIYTNVIEINKTLAKIKTIIINIKIEISKIVENLKKKYL